jgi:hypothetical protein
LEKYYRSLVIILESIKCLKDCLEL